MERRRDVMGEMPFLDHLEELRWRIFYMMITLAVSTIVGFLVVQYGGILGYLEAPAASVLNGDDLVYFNPATPFFLTLKLAIAVGLILALPIIVYQIWAFLSPGLTRRERRLIVPSLYFGAVLFCMGVAMAYFFVLPVALRFLSGFQSEYLTPNIEANEYLGFVTRLLLAFGAVFEMPIVILILSVLGLITPKFLREKRRHAVVGMAILSSLLTPGDLASTIMMMVPMLVLYEVSILLSVAVIKRKENEMEERILQPNEEPPSGAVGAEGP